MTLREKIADWISGGTLYRVGLEDGWNAAVREQNARFSAKQPERDAVARRHLALLEIAAMETPMANGTVRRMAKRAREALE